MIRINTIRPFGEDKSINLSSIEKEFYAVVRNGADPFGKLLVAYLVNCLDEKPLTVQEKKFLFAVINDYDKIILSNPRGLANIIRKYKPYSKILYNEKKSVATDFGKSILNVFNYTNGFRSVQAKGVWFAKKLNIKSCPYCNGQYTLFVKQKDNSGLAKFQFDHYFSKDRYPYLSVSLYNLIPSCASCNHKKSNEMMNIEKHYHPYHNSIHEIAKFKVVYPSDIKKLNVAGIGRMKEDEIKIKFVPKRKSHRNFVSEHDRIFDITPIYERHKDIAHEILMKAVLNNKYYQKGTSSIKGLFPDKATLFKYVLGNYMREDEINRRPLSKLYQDLAKQLKLI